MKNFVLLLSLALLFSIKTTAKDYNILTHGAIPDGKTLNTKAIQAAVDQASKDGGGRVIIPSGLFLSGSIVLKPGVEIHLQKKAVLLGSVNPDDYIKFRRWKALLIADSVNNISLTGKGTIDGQGEQLALAIDSLFFLGKVDSADYNFKDKRPKVTIRPQIIDFVFCNNVAITGITIKNSASWVQSYSHCNKLLIDGVTVDSDAYWNNDGMDIIDCKNVQIMNCFVNSSDDGICLKSYNWPRGHSDACDSIYIYNCTIRSSASAIKFGTANYGGFKNIIIDKIKVFDTFRSAIALESWQRGSIENVLIQNIKVSNSGNAIFIRLGKYHNDHRVGKVENVTIRNLKAVIPFIRPDYDYKLRGPSLPFFHNTIPSSITGIPGFPVKNVILENITITYPGRGSKAYANLPVYRLNHVPEYPDKYPEFSMFGELPAWGFYARHVENLQMKSVKLKVKKPDYRPAIVLDDVRSSRLEKIEFTGDKKTEPIILNNTSEVEITQ